MEFFDKKLPLHPECREGFATARQRKKKTEMTQIWIDQQTALHRMNTWGKGQRPFLFLTDYLHRRWLVEYLDRLSPSELLFAFPGYDNIEGKATATGSFTWHPHPPPLPTSIRRSSRPYTGKCSPATVI